ncbi:MAG: glycosyltransferase family 4 protein [Actinobacteria bacterium]|nr:glycosyltransferase family 4 protein [Actinomycetota bacterium]
MRIGFFCTFFPEKPPFTKTKGFGYGGADESIFDLVTQLHKRGHKITIFSIGKGTKTQYESPAEGLELFRFPVISIPLINIPISLKGFFSFKFLIQEKNYYFDVIHAKLGSPPGGEAALLYKKKFNCPMILDIGGPQNPRWGSVIRKIIMNFYLKFIYSKVLNGCNIITINSKEQILDDPILRPYEEKIRFIPKGLDFNYFSNCEDTTIKNFPYINEIKSNKKIILFVGSLVELKGVHILIKAFNKIKEVYPDLILLIVGQGRMKNELELLVKKLNLTDRVIFMGYMEKESLKKLYKIADLFVLPSMSESFPRVLLESMAAGTPCLVSDIGAHIATLGYGEVGFTAKCFDVEDFAHKINFFFSHEEKWYIDESIKSKKYASKFSWEKTAIEVEKLYKLLTLKKIDSSEKQIL